MESYPLKKQRISDAMFFIFLLALAGLIAYFMIFFMRDGAFFVPNSVDKFIGLQALFLVAVLSLIFAVWTSVLVWKFHETTEQNFVTSVAQNIDGKLLNTRHVSSSIETSNETEPQCEMKDSQRKYASALKRDVARKTAWVYVCSVIVVASAAVLALSMFSRGSLIFGKSYLDLPDLLHHLDMMIPMCIVAFALLASLAASTALKVRIASSKYRLYRSLVRGTGSNDEKKGLADATVQKKYAKLHKILWSYIMGFPGFDITESVQPSSKELVITSKKSWLSRFFAVFTSIIAVVAIILTALFSGFGILENKISFWVFVTSGVLLLIGVISATVSAIDSYRSIGKSSEYLQELTNLPFRRKVISYLNDVFQERRNDEQLVDHINVWFKDNIASKDQWDIEIKKYVIKDSVENGELEMHYVTAAGVLKTHSLNMFNFISMLVCAFSSEFQHDFGDSNAVHNSNPDLSALNIAGQKKTFYDRLSQELNLWKDVSSRKQVVNSPFLKKIYSVDKVHASSPTREGEAAPAIFVRLKARLRSCFTRVKCATKCSSKDHAPQNFTRSTYSVPGGTVASPDVTPIGPENSRDIA